MPGMDGVDICRAIRDSDTASQPYLILLTARVRPEDIVQGFAQAPTTTSPSRSTATSSRPACRSPARIVALQQRLSDRVTELEEALTRVRQLQGLLPICAYCKRIRDDQNYWNQVETYLAEHTDVQFSHGICPSCFDRVIQDDPPGTSPRE